MTTITATPDTATASVQLSITYNSAVSRVLRNDANGIAEVRTLQGQLPTGSSGTLILSDYEAAAGLGTYSVIDAGSGASTTATLVLDKPWLMVPVMPNYALQAESITAYGSDRQSHSTVHTVIGRADPLVSFGPLGTRTGSMQIFCGSLQTARDLETVFTRGEVVMLKQNVTGMDMYFHGSATGVSPFSAQGEEATRWALAVDYVEIKRPVGPLAGALGWDFNALAGGYASFDEVAAKFATFDDLTIQQEI
ncbi:hypothetical protein FCN77_16275 [Arthrobacter sp. 24S4-2]|uniref:hypothetical protein n=1 Tax=Arthrobacter sp. 24S4-2 TaxID=2575374 RepID=UPI0010C774E5|nr:hypothetical protein [Arthrobacter sp. 24S4-2]QCO98971.1 hypothetical protein FCN77_16275 [Arthrobacter sp. 24S4-2]